MIPVPASCGTEWLVEAYGCDPARLADLAAMRALFDRLVADLTLRPVAPTVWHQFPPPGGITGVCVLAESHLTCHTFPEHGSLCLNLFCCTARPEWHFEAGLREMLGAAEVVVRRVTRSYGTVGAESAMVPNGYGAWCQVPGARLDGGTRMSLSADAAGPEHRAPGT